jgi:RNase P subunit RPR2
MFNLTQTFAALVSLLVFTIAANAEDGLAKRVLVYESGTKPSVANRQPHYELRSVQSKSEYLCKKCEELAFPATSATKPSVAASKRNEAFTCEHCGKLVWLDNGVEVTHTAKQDCDACDHIRKGLKASTNGYSSSRAVDRGTKPSAQRNQELSR